MELESTDDVPRPASVATAGVLWVGVGAVVALVFAWLLRTPGDGAPVLLLGSALGGLLIGAGVRTLTGRAHSTVVSGSVSLVLGGTGLVGAVALFVYGSAFVDTDGRYYRFEQVISIVCAALLLVLGAALSTAGVLAVRGEAKYQMWRQRRNV